MSYSSGQSHCISVGAVLSLLFCSSCVGDGVLDFSGNTECGAHDTVTANNNANHSAGCAWVNRRNGAHALGMGRWSGEINYMIVDGSGNDIDNSINLFQFARMAIVNLADSAGLPAAMKIRADRTANVILVIDKNMYSGPNFVMLDKDSGLFDPGQISFNVDKLGRRRSVTMVFEGANGAASVTAHPVGGS